jgi:hypothetical protein
MVGLLLYDELGMIWLLSDLRQYLGICLEAMRNVTENCCQSGQYDLSFEPLTSRIVKRSTATFGERVQGKL